MSSNGVKDLYGRIMPSSKKQINDKIKELNKEIEEKTCKIEDKISSAEKSIGEVNDKVKDISAVFPEVRYDLSVLRQDLKEYNCCIEKGIEGVLSALNTGFNNLTNLLTDDIAKSVTHLATQILKSSEIASLQKENKELKEELMDLKKQIHLIDLQEKKIHRATNETVWSEVFHDAIKESDWLKNKTFYPGRWAAGYPFLYALYRCLNEMQPMSILELGLGQTTRVIGQYAAGKKGCHHIVTEHDKTWIEFFKKDFALSDNTEILHLDINKKNFGDNDNLTTVYEHFSDALSGKKFDLISIDAPFGGVALEYSRMDVLQILPQCLNQSFVILLDDYDRKGEKNMIEQMKKILEDSNIEYTTGLYWGNKDTFMITSEDMRFLTTM